MSDTGNEINLDPKLALERSFGLIKELIDLVENLHEFDSCRVHGIAPGPHSDRAREAAHEWKPVANADQFLHAHGAADAPGKVKRDAGRAGEHR